MYDLRFSFYRSLLSRALLTNITYEEFILISNIRRINKMPTMQLTYLRELLETHSGLTRAQIYSHTRKKFPDITPQRISGYLCRLRAEGLEVPRIRKLSLVKPDSPPTLSSNTQA